MVYLPTIFRDFDEATPAEMQALAQRFLAGHPGFRLQVVPESLDGTMPAATGR